MFLPSKVYDILVWVAKILLPALATLYVAMSNTWGLPYAKEVSETTMAVVLFMGMVLNLSTVQYQKALLSLESIPSIEVLEKEYHRIHGHDKTE